MKMTSLILAAGKGERMMSKTHKALHMLCGKPLIDHVLLALDGLYDGAPLIVVSHEKPQIEAHFAKSGVIIAEQGEELGRGTAVPVKAARELLEKSGDAVLICHCDVPLITHASLKALADAVQGGADAAILTATAADPAGYGRVIREGSRALSITEAVDCTDAQLEINEIYAGAMCFRTAALLGVIDSITNNNAKNEYYLTDTVALLNGQGKTVTACPAASYGEGQGVNDLADLAAAAKLMRSRINLGHMQGGVTLIDPDATYIDASVRIAPGTVIYPGCVLEGDTVIGEDVRLLPNCRIENSIIASGVTIESSVILSASVGEKTTVGPNAYLRPDTVIGKHCRIGDFVELKNAKVGDETKISHLAYVGDAVLGKNINVSCGVVFVNYDGKHKNITAVGDNAFIGCNSNLIAPLEVSAGAYIAAGSTVVANSLIPEGSLFISREKSSYVKENWATDRRARGLLK